jgi:hypothetical protein
MISFNIGVELGQLFALVFLLMLVNIWRSRDRFAAHSLFFNVPLMFAGFMLCNYHLTAYYLGGG